MQSLPKRFQFLNSLASIFLLLITGIHTYQFFNSQKTSNATLELNIKKMAHNHHLMVSRVTSLILSNASYLGDRKKQIEESIVDIRSQMDTAFFTVVNHPNAGKLRSKYERFKKLNQDILENLNSVSTLSKQALWLDWLRVSEELSQSLAEIQVHASSVNALEDNVQSKLVYLNWTLCIIGILLLVSFTRSKIQRFLEQFEVLVDTISHDALWITDKANAVHDSSKKLTGSAQLQSNAIAETVSSMEEMTAMIGQTAQNANRSLEVSETGKLSAERGSQVIQKMYSAMEEIESSSSKLVGIVQIINEIKNKTKIINDIVFETRLLSFNASIEAARAGTYGKGFAVVAEEVGKLAAISGKAAEEISRLLQSSVTDVAQVVQNTQEKVRVGRTVSNECESAFGSMRESLENIRQTVKSIATASQEQALGVKQANSAMAQMDTLTQNNSQSAESLLQYAKELDDRADSLKTTLGDIKELLGDESTSYTTKSKPSKPTSGQSSPPPLKKFANPEQDLNQFIQDLEGKSKKEDKKEEEDVSRSDSRWNAAA